MKPIKFNLKENLQMAAASINAFSDLRAMKLLDLIESKPIEYWAQHTRKLEGYVYALRKAASPMLQKAISQHNISSLYPGHYKLDKMLDKGIITLDTKEVK